MRELEREDGADPADAGKDAAADAEDKGSGLDTVDVGVTVDERKTGGGENVERTAARAAVIAGVVVGVPAGVGDWVVRKGDNTGEGGTRGGIRAQLLAALGLVPSGVCSSVGAG